MFNIQLTLENDIVQLQPLREEDFEKLYHMASDPLIWEQHPNKDRWKREVFLNYFEGAIASKGAFLILDKNTNEVVGSTRLYDFDEASNSIFIGYTFYARKFWGNKVNSQVKTLLLKYVFQFVDTVKFHVGKENFRSRKAMEKLGAELQGDVSVAYYGEPIKQNVEYQIKKELWKR